MCRFFKKQKHLQNRINFIVNIDTDCTDNSKSNKQNSVRCYYRAITYLVVLMWIKS